jgi:hypothetical protein
MTECFTNSTGGKVGIKQASGVMRTLAALGSTRGEVGQNFCTGLTNQYQANVDPA